MAVEDQGFSASSRWKATGSRRPRTLAELATPALLVLLCAEIALALLHLFAHSAPPPLDKSQLWFDLDREGTVASWLSSAQLLLTGLMLAFAASRRWGRGREAALLAAAGAGFVFLSLDEAIMIHERITGFTVEYGYIPRFKGDHGVWIFLYALVGAALLVLFRGGLWAAWRDHRRAASLIGLGFAVMVTGGVWVEVLWYYGYLQGHAQVILEETLEMIGGTLTLCGALVLVSPMVILAPAD